MASFQAKIGRKRLRMTGNRNYPSVPFLPQALQKILNKGQKNSKNEKISLLLHFKPKQALKGWKRERIKIILPFYSYPRHERKLQKNNKKIKKYHYEFISCQNRLEIDEKERNKNYRSVPFRSNLMCNRKFKNKIAKKLKKLKKYHYCLISSQNRLEEAEKERK